ncbi:lytic transglycosylase domain-containing protein [Treponema sp. HNW]|uniref:flagellar assembly lytic transglycosylase n=1 Tax=Treponema sp. HNW TaxID=3116654 RepID=UPI003D0D0FE8
MPHKKVFFPLLFMISLMACGSSKPEFSADYYFDGLKAAAAEKKGEAEKAFRKSIAKDSILAASLAQEELLKLLYEKKDFKSLISLTESLAPEKDIPDTNLAERFQLAALLQSGDKKSEKLAEKRFFSAAFTSADRRLFEKPELSEAISGLPKHIQNALQFRTAFNKRNYVQALNILKEQTENEAGSHSANAGDSPIETSIMLFFDLYPAFPAFSEVCAVLLYGSRDTAERSEYARQLGTAAVFYAEQTSQNNLFADSAQKAFYCALYAARLFARCAEPYRRQAFDWFEKAIAYAGGNALQSENFDKALWYYLDSALKVSDRTAVGLLQTYASQWHDPSYFDDILSLLSYNLLSARNFKGCYAVYESLSPYMSADMLSKYAFISARLGETGLLGADFSKEKIKTALKKAYEAPDGSLYYRLLAAERLDIPFDNIRKSLLRRKKKQGAEADIQAELLLKEYAAQGLEQQLYPLFLRLKDKIGQDTSVELSGALAQKELYPQALRTAVHSFGKSDDPIKQSQLEMLYPRFYKETVEQLCTRYNVPEYLAYALIRSESFFDKDIRSSAGAVGLTQLMESTASDIARKLKIRTYDIADPAVNAEFGIFYLKELIGRLDNSVLLALFSYNAGITKVRRWNAAHNDLSKDLLLEVLPYKETREYGQKILTAAALYACLYYNKTTHDIVREIMQ